MLKTESRSVGTPDADTHLGGPRTRKTFESEEELGRVTAERKARETKFGWQDLANGIRVLGDLVPSICEHCHLFHWVLPDKTDGECICYHPPDTPAWKTRAATKKERADWDKRQMAARERYLAEAPARRAAVAAANLRRNQDDPDANRPLVSDPSRSIGRA